jgi:hypothetical protein
VHPTMHGSVVVSASPPTTAAPAGSAPSATTRAPSAPAGTRTPAASPPAASGALAFTGSDAGLLPLGGIGALFVIAGAWLRRRGSSRGA